MKGVILKVVAILLVTCSIVFSAVIYFNNFHKIDVEVSGGKLLSTNHSDIAANLEEAIQEVEFILVTPETTNQYTFQETGLSLSLDVDGLEKKLRKKAFISSVDCTDLLSFSIYDEEKLLSILESLNENSVKSKDAKLKRGDSWFQLKDERYGNEIVVDLLLDRIKECVNNTEYLFDLLDSGELRIEVTEEDYVKPVVVSSDFNTLLDELGIYESWHMSYTNGFSMGSQELFPYLKIDLSGKVKFEEKRFRKDYQSLISDALSTYTTVGRERKFTSHSGKKITLSGGTYGDRLNLEKELDFIVKSIKKGKSFENRTPELELDMPDKIGDTYIEVNISKQHLWYYVKGKLKMETDIVTGKAGKYDTPKGIYYISEKIPGKYLVGDDYKTWVNYWMRLTNMGVGLHDAYWRRSFGKNIYTYNGSHGCINLPKDFAKNLYDVVKWATPVIVY